MRTLMALATGLLIVAPPAPAQNPFDFKKPDLRSVAVEYQMTGDLSGSGGFVLSGDRILEQTTATGKFFGKQTTTRTWTLITPEWMYSADLERKRGTKVPNLMPYLRQAYDDLDHAGQERFRSNAQAMADLLARAFGAAALNAGPAGTKTIAGERCEERVFGAWSTCMMTRAPQVALHVKGNLFCVDYEQTATAVAVDQAVPASAFDPPAGIAFQEDKVFEKPDSMARGFVLYLASQELTDSLAKAKAELEHQQAGRGKNEGVSEGHPDGMDAEQQRKACDALRDFSLGKMFAGAGKAVAKAAKDAAVEGAKEKAAGKLGGLIRKPKFP